MNSLKINLERINDRVYVFKNKKNKTISLQVDSHHSGEFNYNLALKAAKIILENGTKNTSTQRFRLGKKNWKISKSGKSGFLRFLSKIFDFFHPPGDDGILRYKISHSFFRKKSVKHVRSPEELKKKKYIRKEFKNPFERSCFKHHIKQSKLKVSKSTIVDYKNKIRASEPVSKILDFKQSFFEDPFTKLATVAFQKYEQEFTSKDFFVPDYCHYRIVKVDNKLQLIHQSAHIDIEHSKKAIKLYKKFLIKNFGKEKIAYIEHLYRFKLDEIPSLTPEHIYRINIGLTNLEYQDFDHFLIKLNKISSDIKKFKAIKLDISLEKYLKKNSSLTGREAKGLFQYFNALKKNAKLSDLKDWLDVLHPIPLACKNLSNELFNELLPILNYTNQERDRSLTGRKIFGFIKSGYTTAGLGEYKPWVDQHQLTQFFSELATSRSLTSYAEKLAHVVAKIHLAREHPTEGFRVGALIPAPPQHPGGLQRWYKVTSCISNGYGIFSFTLENACDDDSLPGIKLFRSTASARYALHSQQTVVNDLNNFNAPGYQGIGRTDAYEEKFFKDRTIPIWLGYNLQAEENIGSDNLIESAINLKKAERALLSEFNNKYKIKSLKEIIQANDFLLNDLERKMHPLSCFIAFFGCSKLSKKWDYARLFQQLIKSYILKTQVKSKKLINEKQDAKDMVAVLKKIYKLEKSKSTKLQIKIMIAELNKNILTDEAKNLKKKARAKFDAAIYNKIKTHRLALQKALKANKDKKAEENINALIDIFNQHAEDCGESINAKKRGGIHLMGHSLGGACTAAATVRWFKEKNRMPVPDTHCSVYLFDEPGINKKSNRAFLHWGYQHRHLFKLSNVKFGIIRRQEAGDIVVTAGEEHLGAVYSEEEEKRLAKWLSFDAAVLKRHIDSRHFPISLPLTAHETRFLEGTQVNTFYTREEVLQLRKKWKAKKHHPDRKKALKQIQANLDKPRDYICTSYTPFVQGIFNKQGHFKDRTDEENKEFTKQFYDLKTRLWNLQRFMDPTTAEQARKSVSIFWTVIRKLLVRGNDTYFLDPIYTDIRGNFAVGEKGVLTKRGSHKKSSQVVSAA